ncbi:uncharacterized protein (DUF885 family) [Sphingomonas kaistensis]|uniref:Uncharacterized protein (DUF885 family) n=1 Tax=Sphingomonas kaistensis TaxID=298708 RepID=A0A7X6BG25_9SPHN|nr:DUF885 domain-containing protein [Sphingomonas kaistensis]NJC06009.1 uncharacterized protein (DUF885 family) [Sphingomonas kaistensis]
MKIKLSALLLLTTAACTTADGDLAAPRTAAAVMPVGPVEPVVTPAAEDQRLTVFLDAAFEEQVARSPQGLTGLGRKERYNELNSYTDANAAEGLALAQRQLASMRAQFDPAKLSPNGRLSYQLFEREVQQNVENFRWRRHGFIASTNGSPAGSLPVFLINNHKIASVADAEAYISRLQAVERVMGEITTNMRAQTAAGIVPSTFNFAPVRKDAEKVLAGAPFTTGPETPVYADFRAKVAKLDAPQAEKDRLLAAARDALTGPFQRGYRSFLATWTETERQAKGNRGAWGLPDGAAFYANRLKNSTTTSMSAAQIHQLGLDQVAAIHGEMERIKTQVGFKGTLRQFFDELRSNPKYRYPDTDAGRAAYIKDAEGFVAQVMAKSPQWFRRLPKAALEVRAVEKWREGTAAIAFYNSPSEDGSRPGIYYSNLANMADVSKPQLEARSYHEGAPGHHFQIALAQELPNVPKFRRFGGYGAYAEGWGLYAEGLGKEMGFYQDPISEFGMLSTQVWRAVRLVVDSGIHDKRWTREQAIDYFLANAPLSRADAVREVERYFNWPGQATSYMVGQLKILELRERAKRELGDKFDIRDFHAAVLENGSLPLDVLEEQVNAYIAARKAA